MNRQGKIQLNKVYMYLCVTQGKPNMHMQVDVSLIEMDGVYMRKVRVKTMPSGISTVFETGLFLHKTTSLVFILTTDAAVGLNCLTRTAQNLRVFNHYKK
jgi:hypothetical protein